jgi:CubicO group peptidase (beta-lactamase class C family)
MVLFRAATAFCVVALFAYMSTAATNEVRIQKKPLLTNSVASLDDLLQPIREEHNLPALAAAVCSDTELLASGAVGLRKIGSSESVLLSDKFHLGSCTKSMTALLAAIMIERGELSWDTTVRDLFSDRALAPNMGDITLEQLLTHRSGLPFNVSDRLWAKAFTKFRGTGQEERDLFFKEALLEKLQRRPGRKYIYSNTGYALAGAIIERRAGQAWEDLVQQEIFTPLHMETGGFGPPNFRGKIDQPWGHTFEKGEPKAIPPRDNPLAIAPAAAAHCSILDLAQYASFHLAAAQGKGPFVSKTTLGKLYNPPPVGFFNSQDYACGWLVVDRGWAGGKALTHAGSNTMFYSLIWIAPSKNIAFVVCTNASSSEEPDPAQAAAEQVIFKLIQNYLHTKP